MISHSLRVWLWTCICGLAPWSALAQDVPQRLSPDDAVVAALSVSSAIRDARAAQLAAQGHAAQNAVALNNPSLQGSVSVDGRRASASLSQPFSLTGEGIFARQSANAALRAAEAELERAAAITAAQARLAWVDARLASLSVDVAQRAVSLSERLDRAVNQQLAVGEVSPLDQRLTHLANTRASVALLDAQAYRAQALARLSELIGVVAEPEGDLLDAAPAPNLDVTVSRPDLQARREAVVGAEKALQRFKAATMPAMSLGVWWNMEDQEHFVGPQVSLTLPVFQRAQAPRMEAQGQRDVARLAEQTTQARVDAELAFERQRVQGAEAVLARVAPAFEQDAQAALDGIASAYRAGEFDLTTTLLLQREILDGLQAGWTLRARVAAARIAWMLAVGDASGLQGGAP